MNDDPHGPHAVIEQSWRRSRLNGVDPAAAITSLPQVEIDRESRLLRAAGPILDQLASKLAGERFGLLLTDARARIVDRRVGLSLAGDRLDDMRRVEAPGRWIPPSGRGPRPRGCGSVC